MADDDDKLTIEQQVERAVTARLQADRDARERKARLTKLGLTDDVLDAIADSVFGRFQRAADERAQADEDADQAPSRGSGQRKPSFLQSIGLAANDE